MKICIIVDRWSWPVIGGGDVYVWEMSKKLVELFDCSVDIYSPYVEISDTNTVVHHKNIRLFSPAIKKIQTENYVVRSLNEFLLILFMFRNQFKEHYSLINSHGYVSAIIGKIISILCWLPIVHTVHGSNSLDLKKGDLKYYLEKIFLTLIPFDYQITVAQHFKTFFNVNRRIEYIPVGVDVTRFNSLNKRIKNKIFTFIWVGRFDPIKGLFDLLNAVRILKTKHKFVLNLVGNGSQENDLRKFVIDNNLERNVKFLGAKYSGDLVSEYHRADAFVLSSLSEGFPLTILEAMSAKLLIVSTKVGEIGNLITDGVNGYLATPGNPESLMKAMDRAVNSASSSEIIDRNYNLVQREYSWQNVATHTYKILRLVKDES